MKKERLPKDYLTAIGHRIKLVRTYLNLDQKEMSVLLETAQSQVSKIEAGKSAPTLYQLLKIKQALEKEPHPDRVVSWSWLLEGRGKGVIG